MYLMRHNRRRGFFIVILVYYFASYQNFSKAKDLITLQRDFNVTLSAIQSWSGTIKIEIKGGESPYEANGTFAWDAAQEAFRCSIEYPIKVDLLGQDRSVVASSTIKRLREVIVSDNARIEIWHGGLNTSVPGYKIIDSDRERAFSIGYRKELDPISLMVPQLEFCPEYLYRGNIPSMKELLRLAVEHAESPGVDSLHGLGDDGRYFIRTGDGKSTMFFAIIEGVWLPVQILSSDTETNWNWSLNDGLIIPSELVISDIPGETVSSYITTENQLNLPIDERLFDANSFKANEGDYLVDDVSSKLFRFNGSAFVGLDEEPVKSNRHRIFTLFSLIACALICLFFAAKRSGSLH